MNLPNFIIIGGMKCGTTSLYYYLNSHPEISMSSQKELDFFIESGNWNKGIKCYQSQFLGKTKIYGEASLNYTNYPFAQRVPEKGSPLPNILVAGGLSETQNGRGRKCKTSVEAVSVEPSTHLKTIQLSLF